MVSTNIPELRKESVKSYITFFTKNARAKTIISVAIMLDAPLVVIAALLRLLCVITKVARARAIISVSTILDVPFIAVSDCDPSVPLL